MDIIYYFHIYEILVVWSSADKDDAPEINESDLDAMDDATAGKS